LITISRERDIFEMHQLVQLATRKWLEMAGQMEECKMQFLVNLGEAFPTGKFRHWKMCQSLFAHAKAAMAQRPEYDEAMQIWARILHNAVLGEGHPDTLTSMANLAFTWKSQERNVEALELMKACLLLHK
jgi:hypothetical protein